MWTLTNPDVSVTIDVEYGARITSLRDLLTGREWMLQGERGGDTTDSAVYRGADAVGWDECFPTVAPWDASATPWARVLRDHGDLWGRPARLVEQTDTRLVTEHDGPLYRFRRTLELNGSTLRALYRLENLVGVDLPYLWAAHGMLHVTPQDRIVLPAVSAATATYLAREGKIVSASELPWPGPSTSWSDPLDRVQAATSRQAAKLYVDAVPGRAAYVGRDSGWLRIGWSKEINSLGIWLNYGGWPEPGDVHHIGLEPTNAPVDHLGQAIDRGTPKLAANSEAEWSVEYTVRATAQ